MKIKTDTIKQDHFFIKVSEFIEKNKLINKNDRILCAVSGGPDSITLLYILYALKDSYNIRVEVAHLEHGIRGYDSLRDQAFVKSIAKELDLVFHTKNVNINKLKKGGESIEEIARKVRLSFLEEVSNETNCNKIALGHTLDDHIETIIFRLINGTGQKGIKGITACKGKIIRPLLGVTKEEI